MELKHGYYTHVTLLTEPFNQTRMELKPLCAVAGITSEATFNQTRMELKPLQKALV